MSQSQVLTIEQIDALLVNELPAAYELAVIHLDKVQAKKACTPEEKAALRQEIQAAHLQWMLLRNRRYPKHYSSQIQVASQLPARAA